MAPRASKPRPYTVAPAGQWAVARLTDPDGCPECGGAGVSVTQDEAGQRTVKPCSCRTLRRKVELFNRARVPAHYANRTIDTYSPTGHESQGDAHQKARDLIRTYPIENRGLVLTGPVGVGKTHLAAGIVRELTLEKGVPCRFVDFLALLHDLKATYERRAGTAELMESLAEVDVLVIDDLGKGRGNDWELEVLDELVGRRYNAGSMLIATTNYRDVAPRVPRGRDREPGENRDGFVYESLQQRVGDRIYSRLLGMCAVLPMEGDDYRRSAAMKRGRK